MRLEKLNLNLFEFLLKVIVEKFFNKYEIIINMCNNDTPLFKSYKR